MSTHWAIRRVRFFCWKYAVCAQKRWKILALSVLTTFQDFDKDPFGSSSDPFGDKKDPFADKADPFGSADKGPDVFASPEEKKDPFGASDSDPFGETKPTSQADPFAQKTQARVWARIIKSFLVTDIHN